MNIQLLTNQNEETLPNPLGFPPSDPVNIQQQEQSSAPAEQTEDPKDEDMDVAEPQTPSTKEDEESNTEVPTSNPATATDASTKKPRRKIIKTAKKRAPNASTSSNSVPAASTSTTSAFSLSSKPLSVTEKRKLEHEAYAAVISAFKAQGELTWKKEQILQDLRAIFKVSDDRHKQELKRVEETVPSARARKSKSYDFDSDSELDSDNSVALGADDDEDAMKPSKKRMKVTKELPNLSALPLPNSENLPGYVNKVPTAKKAGKKTKGGEKRKNPRKTAGEETDESKPKVKKEKKKSDKPKEKKKKETAAPSALPGIPTEEDLIADLPPDVLAARESGNLELLREVLEKHKANVRAQLEALNSNPANAANAAAAPLTQNIVTSKEEVSQNIPSSYPHPSVEVRHPVLATLSTASNISPLPSFVHNNNHPNNNMNNNPNNNLNNNTMGTTMGTEMNAPSHHIPFAHAHSHPHPHISPVPHPAMPSVVETPSQSGPLGNGSLHPQ